MHYHNLTLTVLEKWNAVVSQIQIDWIPQPGQQWLGQAWSLVAGLWFYLVISPFIRLILQGPWLGGYGFWNGMSAPEICSRLGGGSGPAAEHYLANPALCLELIERDLQAKLVLFDSVIYALLLGLFITTLFRKIV